MSFDPNQFIFDKKVALEHFFSQVYIELSEQPAWSLYLYKEFSYKLMQESDSPEAVEEGLKLLRKIIKQITNEDIELFLLYEIDFARNYVNDLLVPMESNAKSGQISSRINRNGALSGRSSRSPERIGGTRSAIDKETKNFAKLIESCPLYK